MDSCKHPGRNGALDWQRNAPAVEEPGYSTFLFADEAIRLLGKRVVTRQFFLEVSFNAPHSPSCEPDEYLAQYKNHSMLRATGTAAVDAVVGALGRILAVVDQPGRRENALVIFFSDNGAGGRFPEEPARAEFRAALSPITTHLHS